MWRRSLFAAAAREEVLRLHDLFKARGFEGVMVRNAAGVYARGTRSKDLQ